MIALQRKTVGMAPPGRPKIGLSENPIPHPPTLAEADAALGRDDPYVLTGYGT
jgi:hypothetical protein